MPRLLSSLYFFFSSIFLYIFSLLCITCLFLFEFPIFSFFQQSLLHNLFTFFFVTFLPLCPFTLKRRFILRARGSGNAMRFSLRNSRVKISFLYLRGLLALLLYLSLIPPTPSPPPSTPSSPPSLRDTPVKSLHRRVGNIFCPSTFIIYASTNTRVSSLDFLLSREEIDRFSFTLRQATREVFILRLSRFSIVAIFTG